MTTAPYLLRLTLRLAEGVSQLPAEVRARHADYLRAAQYDDGGFSGREGGSDLYYTGFALRGLAVLDALTPTIAERRAGFPAGSLAPPARVFDFFSLPFSRSLAQPGGGPEGPPPLPPPPERGGDGGGGLARSCRHTFREFPHLR